VSGGQRDREQRHGEVWCAPTVRARRKHSLACVVVVLASVGDSRAEPPAVGATRPGAGAVEVTLTDERSLKPDVVGEPLTLALDAVIGLTPDLALGFSQSASALGRMGGGGGWCRDSEAHDCAGAYAGGYLDARWRVPGAATVTGLTRLGVDGTSPWRPVLRLGVIARGRDRLLWWAVQPEVAVALGGRGNGNRDALQVPAWVGVDLAPVTVWAESGLAGDLDEFADDVKIRLGVGAAARWRSVTGALAVGFPQLLGPDATARIRVLTLALTWRR